MATRGAVLPVPAPVLDPAEPDPFAAAAAIEVEIEDGTTDVDTASGTGVFDVAVGTMVFAAASEFEAIFPFPFVLPFLSEFA